MNYFTATIPTDLAEKLKEKGMPITMSYHLHQPEPNVKGLVRANFKEIDCPTYAEVFDWLLGEKIYVRIIPFGASRIGEETWDWTYYIDQLGEPYTETEYFWDTWQEAADKAIEKTLEMI